MRRFLLIPAVISLASFVLLYGKFLGRAAEFLALLTLFLPVAVVPCSIIGSYMEVRRWDDFSLIALVIHIAGIASVGCFIYAWYVLFRYGF